MPARRSFSEGGIECLPEQAGLPAETQGRWD